MTYPPHRPPVIAGPSHAPLGWAPPPEPPENGSARMLSLIVILLVATIVTAIVGGALIRHENILPTSVPLIGKDSGVAACEAIVRGDEFIHTSGDRMTTAEFRKARAIFGDSRYPAIRDNGVKLIDIAWQLGNVGENGAGLLTYATSLSDAYAGLAGGCAEVGYTLPPLIGD